MPRENWLLDVLRGEIDPKNEANTSRYVHEVLHHCLEWPFEAIRPQSSKRGFIDYELRHDNGDSVHIEVKPIKTSLKDDMIRKYLSSRTRNFDIGVLTNLNRWRILAAGSPVKRLTGQSVMCIYDIDVTKREHIGQIS